MNEYKRELAFAHEHEPVLDRFYKKTYPKSTTVRFEDNTPEQINNDTDLVMTCPDGTELLLEEKIVRSKNYSCIYVEDMSCPAMGKPGWIHTSKAHFLVWCFVEPDGSHRVFVINFSKLKKHFLANKDKYQGHQNMNTLNKSTGYKVPLSDIKECIVYAGVTA